MRWTGVAQAGHGLPCLPCTAISGRKAVTFLGELLAGVQAQPLCPVEKRPFRRVVETGDLRVGESRRESDRRKLRSVEDLVGVRVSDAGEERRIRQGAFQRVVLAPQARGKDLARRTERLETAGIERDERVLSG